MLTRKEERRTQNRVTLKQVTSSRARTHQIKTRDRVRDLAEVYTHKHEVDAMLDLVVDMFPSTDDPTNTDRTFLEPACGSGNFLEEILLRKLRFITAERYGHGARYEHRMLRAIASLYGIDIDQSNIDEARDRLRAVINSHLDLDLNTRTVTEGFATAVEVVLATNIICADTLKNAAAIELVEYRPGRNQTFTRQWSFLAGGDDAQLDLFAAEKCDEAPVHYSELHLKPGPVLRGKP